MWFTRSSNDFGLEGNLLSAGVNGRQGFDSPRPLWLMALTRIPLSCLDGGIDHNNNSKNFLKRLRVSKLYNSRTKHG